MMFAALASAGIAQNTITVVEGDDLITKVAEAADGDTIAIQPGFHVAHYDNVLVNKSLSFISTDKNVKPLVFIKQFDIEGTDLKILFEGINFSTATVDSAAQTVDTTTLFSADSYFINLTSNHVSMNSLTIRNCVIRNVGRAVLRGDRVANTAENILIDNCMIYDQRGAGDYGPFRTKSNIDITNFTIQNSTFYAITNRFIDMESAPGSPTVIVKNCTFHRWGGGKTGQYLFDMKNNTTAVLKIQSCILGKTNENELVAVNGFRVPLASTMEMTNSCMAPDFVCTDSAYSAVTWDKTEFNLEDTDPGFEDPDNGNFMLPEESDLLQWSPDGTVIGDPRWDPTPEVGTQRYTLNTVKVYPNPASEYFTIDIKGLNKVQLYNVSGQLVKQFDNVFGNSMIPVSGLEKGLYLLKVSGDDTASGLLMIK